MWAALPILQYLHGYIQSAGHGDQGLALFSKVDNRLTVFRPVLGRPSTWTTWPVVGRRASP